MAFKSNIKYKISDERREEYRNISAQSAQAKRNSINGIGEKPIHPINVPCLNPQLLMPKKHSNNFRALSLFSGGGGMDLGFDNAGFEHVSSYEIIPICGETLEYNRPKWNIFSGDSAGDVTRINWSQYKGKVDVIHGGPPCQPFSIAGQRKGIDDERNMWGSFSNAVNSIKPLAFVAENVKGILSSKFTSFVEDEIILPLSDYHIKSFVLNAAGFGVPQKRERVFFVGFLDQKSYESFKQPTYTHSFEHFSKNKKNSLLEGQEQLLFDELPKCMGIREALGLPSIGNDILTPTIRSAFTGKRNTTSILNSGASAKSYASVEIWGSGVGADRQAANNFVTKNGHFRLAVQDCSILQGFPETWEFQGAVYKILGQIGNSVAPPVAYNVAVSVAQALEI